MLTGAKGLNLWSSFRDAAAAAQRAAVSRAGRARPRVVRVRRRCCRPSIRSSTRCRRPRPTARRSPRSKPRCSRRSSVGADGVTDAELAKAKAQLNARLVFDNDSVTNIAHQLGYFETIASVDLFTTRSGAHRRGHARRGRRGGAQNAGARRIARSAGSSRACRRRKSKLGSWKLESRNCRYFPL